MSEQFSTRAACYKTPHCCTEEPELLQPPAHPYVGSANTVTLHLENIDDGGTDNSVTFPSVKLYLIALLI